MSNMLVQRPTTRASAPKPQSILIVGCGIAGPVLASLLLRFPGPASSLPHITILERNPSLTSSGQNIDIRGIGKQIIGLLDLEDEIKRFTTGEEGVRFVDENNCCWAEFAVDKSGKVETGTSDVEILRGRLAEILLDKTKRDSKDVQDRGGKGVEFIFEDSLESLHQDEGKVHVQLANGGERSFDLVVGADGLHSRTRKLAFGNEAEGCLKKLHMFAAFFSMPKEDEDGEWRSWFHAPGGVSIMLRPSGTKEKSTVLILLADKSGIIADQLAGSERSIPAQKKLVMSKLNRIGMGTTLALAGAYHLAGSLVDNPSSHSQAFEAYEEAMRPLVANAQKLPPAMPHLIHPQSTWGVWVLRILVAAIYWSGVGTLLFKWKGPPASVVKLKEYGILAEKGE
ncbi:putative oxidoreductase [Aureobasidium pullulans]|uniref:Oxidoreductase n=1 Tax=Aureobasidium pullulans TaxID=5580 RepID=A0AB74JQC0_AURPU|nr:putative oxidoreductase [Aureobasidium pullulans]